MANWWAQVMGGCGAVAILIGIGSLAQPEAVQAHDAVDAERLADAVVAVRSVLGTHRHNADIRTNNDGWPLAINPEWFPLGELPRHPETDRPFVVEIVDAGFEQVAPSDKFFDAANPKAKSLWYNRSNGAVAARVPIQSGTLDAFNRGNLLAFSRLEQTCR